jgi:hypothetical protein
VTVEPARRHSCSLPDGGGIMANVARSFGGLRINREDLVRNPEYQAYQLLHVAFIAAPVIAGLDKFFHLLVNWDAYVAPFFVDILGGPGGAHVFMTIVGAVEIGAGLIVALKPRIGAYVVAAWLVAIMIDLVANGRYFDIALRDLGLFLAALALARLAVRFDPPRASTVR